MGIPAVVKVLTSGTVAFSASVAGRDGGRWRQVLGAYYTYAYIQYMNVFHASDR